METNKFLAKQEIEEKVFYIWEDFFEDNFVRAFVRNIDSFYLEEVSEDLRVEVEYSEFDQKTLFIRGYDKNVLKKEVEIGDQESFDEFSDKLNLVIEALGLNETEEVYYTGAIYDIEQIAEDFEEDKEVVLLKGLIDLRDSGLIVVYYRPGDIDIIATGTKEQFKEFVKTNEYMSEYDWHAYGGGGAMVDELIATESLWVDDNVENAKRHSTNLDNEIRDLIADLPEEKINKLNENKTLNEREGNNKSLEQRVISVLDEHRYLEKIREYAYNYYYDKVDYRDQLDLDTIDDLVASAQSGDWTDAWVDLTSNFNDAGYILEYIANGVVEELEKVAPLTNEEFDEVSQLLWDFIQIDYTTYLDDEVPVYIMVDTGDGNYDFTLNPNYSFNWDGETTEDEPLELASLTWLAGTQGYTLDQVLEAFREGRRDSKFLNSVVREGLNNSTSMSAVTFLGTMRILDLLNAASGNGDVTINADTRVGLFDTWSGSGSLFDIELEQSLVIPGNIIGRIGTARGRGDNGYTPDQVYGFSGSVYDSNINLLNGLDTDVLEEQEENLKELDWLLNLPEGFVVAISACRGKDCSRTDELEERLRKYNYIRVVGKWDGVEEISFLVYVRTREEVKKLINLGTKTFNQDDVYVWETPMNIKDITKNTSDEGTKLDGDYYFFDLDKIILKRSDLEKSNN